MSARSIAGRGGPRIVWHRGDLRVHDHPALCAAVEAGPVVGLVVLDPHVLDATAVRRRAHFGANVRALRDAYEARGGVLLVRTGDPVVEVPALARSLDVMAVHALRSYTPYGRARDEATARALGDVPIHWHAGLYIHEPGTVRTRGGHAYTVFAPFYRAWQARPRADPLEPPAVIAAPALPPDLPPGGIPPVESDVPLPDPGEGAALAALEGFVEHRLAAYADARDRLDGSGTSRLSVWLTIGALSARTALARVEHHRRTGRDSWIRELAWRDFLADLLYDRPHLLDSPLDEAWSGFRWSRSRKRLEAWRDGTTGIPAVDAAMRELRATGWISNRARMIAAQFLAKHLRVDWRQGERIFRDWLLDGDTASNVGNWQWAAGLGIDNAPWFRVFNPVTQAQRCDPDGAWLRRWVPECDGDPRPLPHAIVDLKQARQEYLDAARAAR